MSQAALRALIAAPGGFAAGYLLSFVMVRRWMPVWALAAGTALAALMMVSTLKVPKFRKGGLPSVMLFVADVPTTRVRTRAST